MNYQPTDTEKFELSWIIGELYRIAASINSDVKQIHHAPPERLVLGLELIADGVDWNPLSLGGSNPYKVLYNGTSWQAI